MPARLSAVPDLAPCPCEQRHASNGGYLPDLFCTCMCHCASGPITRALIERSIAQLYGQADPEHPRARHLRSVRPEEHDPPAA
jgi:hypothetical protein